MGSDGGGRGAGAVGGGGVKARFLSGGSPLFLVESLLFSDIVADLKEITLRLRGEHGQLFDIWMGCA